MIKVAIVLKYQDDFDEMEVLDGDVFNSVDHIIIHLMEKHGGNVNEFSTTLKDDQISLIRLCMTDSIDESFYVDALFKDITR